VSPPLRPCFATPGIFASSKRGVSRKRRSIVRIVKDRGYCRDRRVSWPVCERAIRINSFRGVNARARALYRFLVKGSRFVSRDGDTAPATFTSGLCNLNATVTTFVADSRHVRERTKARYRPERERERARKYRALEVQSRFMDAAFPYVTLRSHRGLGKGRGIVFRLRGFPGGDALCFGETGCILIRHWVLRSQSLRKNIKIETQSALTRD